MDILMISPYIFIFILLIINVNIFFPETFTGKLLIRGRKRKVKGKLALIIALVCFGVLIILNIIKYKDKSHYIENILFQIFLYVFWMVYLSLQFIKGCKPVEIREKGIFIENGIFIKFKKIYSYTWKSQNILELDSKRVFKLGDDYQLKFEDQEEALRFDSILQSYVKKV